MSLIKLTNFFPSEFLYEHVCKIVSVYFIIIIYICNYYHINMYIYYISHMHMYIHTYIWDIYVYRVFISVIKERHYLNIFHINYYEGQIVQTMSHSPLFPFLFILEATIALWKSPKATFSSWRFCPTICLITKCFFSFFSQS